MRGWKKSFFFLLKIQLPNLTKGPILGAHVRTKAGRTRKPTREVQRKLEQDLAKLDLDLEEVPFKFMLLDAQALMWVRETTGEECSQIWNPDFISTGCVWNCTRSIPAWGEMLFNELVHFWRLDALSPFWLEEEEEAWGGIRNRIPACLEEACYVQPATHSLLFWQDHHHHHHYCCTKNSSTRPIPPSSLHAKWPTPTLCTNLPWRHWPILDQKYFD